MRIIFKNIQSVMRIIKNKTKANLHFKVSKIAQLSVLNEFTFVERFKISLRSFQSFEQL